MYVSFDDGDDWQSLMLNLPNTSYRDIAIKDNDLVIGTYGRSLWILDDFSPLRQITPAIESEPAHLFKPGDAIRVRYLGEDASLSSRPSERDRFLGRNGNTPAPE